MKILLDDKPVEASLGETILAVAKREGIDIPTLCFLEQCEPATSCLVCIVKIKGTNRFVPSCATRVQEGMEVESETTEVHEARRAALELLLSDHVGDCLSPCHRICPFNLNIPALLREIEREELNLAVDRVTSTLPLPLFVSRLCPAPCENGCRRKSLDDPAAIRDLERYVIDYDLNQETFISPTCEPSTHTRVAVIGAGPAGLSTAWELALLGQEVTVFDRNKTIGGSLQTHDTSKDYHANLLEGEHKRLEGMGIRFQLGHSVSDQRSLAELKDRFDAVIFACGEVEEEWAKTLNLEMKDGHVLVQPNSFKTNVEGVYALGAMTKPVRQVIRLMSECIEIARNIHRQILGTPLPGIVKGFSSMMGKLNAGELTRFVEGAVGIKRMEPALGHEQGYTEEEAKVESSRCLHCDCRAVQHCKLKHFASQYHANATRYGSRGREFFQVQRPGSIVYEPGKCIACGICVQIAAQAGEPLGLTFVGRGFDVEIGVPLDGGLDEALQYSANECVEYCPTGALAFRGKMHCCDCGGHGG